MIAGGADLNAQNSLGETALHWMAIDGRCDIARLLIKNGADINIQDNYGNTPLCIATKYNKIRSVELLIENGADPFIKDYKGRIPLDITKNEEIRKLLEEYMEEYKKNPDKFKPTTSPLRDSESLSIKNNKLLFSAYDNNLSGVKRCIASKKFNINVRDNKGYTPLMYAIMNHNLNMVEFLVEHGADINLCNNKGQSPLKIAYLYDSKGIAEYLFSKGAVDQNIEDGKQNLDKNRT